MLARPDQGYTLVKFTDTYNKRYVFITVRDDANSDLYIIKKNPTIKEEAEIISLFFQSGIVIRSEPSEDPHFHDDQIEKLGIDDLNELVCELLKSDGWSLEPEDISNVTFLGDIIYFEMDDTAWEVDIKNETRRHRGLESGCFWTEWK